MLVSHEGAFVGEADEDGHDGGVGERWAPPGVERIEHLAYRPRIAGGPEDLHDLRFQGPEP